MVTVIVLSGCEGTIYPLGDATESVIEQRFVGSWVNSDPDSDKVTFLNILPFNDHEYLGMAWNAVEDDGLALFAINSTIVNGE